MPLMPAARLRFQPDRRVLPECKILWRPPAPALPQSAPPTKET